MDLLGLIASIFYQLGTNAAFLLLCALGLIVILGMMRQPHVAEQACGQYSPSPLGRRWPKAG